MEVNKEMEAGTQMQKEEMGAAVQIQKVWLVGAGPSDVELLTLKARRLLEAADVIVYDRLPGQGALLFSKPHAELIDVGKTAGHHTLPQEEIGRLLVKKAREGKRVVRLKGGDPFVFGRGGEEAQQLSKEGIPFGVVPGVTSAVAVPAYAGIPVTHRGTASAVHIITAHQKNGELSKEQLAGWAKLTGTLVFLMGVTALSKLTEGLMAAGMAPDCPAAVVERGTMARQRTITGTVGTLCALAEEKKVQTPAIIVVGEVCALQGIGWREMDPLFGKKILVTRPRERSGRLAGMLRELGAEVAEVPSIRIVPETENERLLRALERIRDYQWIAFTSPAGAELFLQLLKEQRTDIRRLGGLQIACIGAGTQKVLEERGIFPELVPSVYDGEHLGTALGSRLQEGEKVLLPRARQGSTALLEHLQKAYRFAGEAKVEEIPLYDTVPAASPYFSYREELLAGGTDYVMLTSASTVRGLYAAAKETAGADCLRGVKALCIGRQTAQEAEKYGMATSVAKEATLLSLVELAVKEAAKEARV